MTKMSGDMAEISVTDFITLPKLGRVHQCMDPTTPQNWSGPDPWTGWKLTPLTPCLRSWNNDQHGRPVYKSTPNIKTMTASVLIIFKRTLIQHCCVVWPGVR